MSTETNKRQKTESQDIYHLIYWPGIPGRGEHIRLTLEQAGVEYTDTAQIKDGFKVVQAALSGNDSSSSNDPTPLAPPILKHAGHTLSQTPNILLYLGQNLGLAPSMAADPVGLYYVNQLTLTALDGLSNEPHDTHHPIAVAKYYEDQVDEAKKKAEDYRENRLPKFVGYFEGVLERNASGGEWLYGGQLTYADLVLFQCVDGLAFAFPKCVERLEGSGKYRRVFELRERVRQLDNVKAYLGSERRQKYGMGIYRYYEELDG